MLLTVFSCVNGLAGEKDAKPIPECRQIGPPILSPQVNEGWLPCIGPETETDSKRLGLMHYRLIGPQDTKKPALVLIPGNGNDMSSFAPVVSPLAAHYRVLLIDQPGFGQSETTSDRNKEGFDDYSPEATARSLKRLLTQLKLRDVILLGHSLGARTALVFTKRYATAPGGEFKVRQLIFEDMETIPGVDKKESDRKAFREKVAALKRDLDREFRAPDELKKALQQHFPKPETAPAIERWMSERLCRGKRGFRLDFRLWVGALYQDQVRNGVDLTSELDHTTAPLLVMRAVEGSSVTEPGLDAMKRARPDCVVVPVEPRNRTVPNHDIHTASPEKFVKTLEWFTGVVRPTKGSPPSPSEPEKDHLAK